MRRRPKPSPIEQIGTGVIRGGVELVDAVIGRMKYTCVRTEHRLLGAMLFEPDALPWCDDVETDYFANLHHRFAFTALRNVQARGSAVSFDAVDAELDRTGAQQVNRILIAATGFEAQYRHESLVRIDSTWLRKLARRRADV